MSTPCGKAARRRLAAWMSGTLYLCKTAEEQVSGAQGRISHAPLPPCSPAMFWLLLLAALALLLYWELVIAEGAHLGPGVVAWLYDLVAYRYNQIKKFNPEIEADLVGLPLLEALIEIERPRVLDVAAGNGRVARALMRQIAFEGSVTSLDLSARMVVEGQRECAEWADRVQWMRGPADGLPFAAETFDAVTCLEALEFLPDPRAALHEWVRVLRVGGVLVVTNRVGLEARLIVGKTFGRGTFVKILKQLPLADVRVEAWQVEYDLAWGRKAVNSRQ